MPSEANKIRNQCARKYGVREKAYKDRIASLQMELDHANALLEDYNNMKKEYLKLVLYCGLSEKDKEKVLRSEELNDMVGRWAGLLGIAGGSADLRRLANCIFQRDPSMQLTDVLKEIEERGFK